MVYMKDQLLKVEGQQEEKNNHITDLTPLKNLTDLQVLDLSNNNITDLTPLKNLTNLRELQIYEYQLTDHIQKTNQVVLSHLTQTLKEELDNFLITHGFLGLFFDYYEDKGDVATKKTVQIDFRSLTVKPKILLRKGVGFLWEYKIKIREVIA